MTDQIQTIQLSSLSTQELDNLQYNEWITSPCEEKDLDVFEIVCKFKSKTASKEKQTNVTEL
tara:strand:- start:386 stop:571 length:186 start_codon:yes stop_codon:yes gene_type:complete